MKFTGTIQELLDFLNSIGEIISSKEDNDGKQILKVASGATITLYKTGTLQVQGKADIKHALVEKLQASLISNQNQVVDTSMANKTVPNIQTVFIVHGHDEASREQLELILHKLGIEHFVLASHGGQGLTIIEALEERIGHQTETTSFGIVLMTPDDMGYAQSEGSDAMQPRARQNVILEMGMLIGSIGRKNIAILVKGHLEKPSDASGILYLPYNSHVKEVVPKLSRHLQTAGFNLSSEQITNASS